MNQKKFSEKRKKHLLFSGSCSNIYERLRVRFRFPGVAKFGIALEWGSRGPEFESRHSDHTNVNISVCSIVCTIGKVIIQMLVLLSYEDALKSLDFKAFLYFIRTFIPNVFSC